MLSSAFNLLLKFHGRDVTIERPGGDALLSGIAPVANPTLNSDIAAGVAFMAGVRRVLAAEVAHAFTAERDTYIDVNPSGVLVYTEVTNAAPSPAIVSGNLRAYRVVTSATEITAVTLLAVIGKSYGINAQTVRVTPSNYFRNLSAPEELTVEGREFVISKKALDNIYFPAPKKNDRIVDPVMGTNVISEVQEMMDFGGTIMGFRVRTS